MRPRTQYARSGDVHIAYQVFGEGPDLLWIPGWVSQVEHWWDHPRPASFIRRLGSFARVILFDKRGTGMSDRTAGVPSLDERLDDMRAVLGAAGSNRPSLLGITFEGSVLASLWAATYPAIISRLILYGATAKMTQSDDYPWGRPPESLDVIAQVLEERWNDDSFALEMMAPSHHGDEALREWFGRWARLSASPGTAARLFRSLERVDVRSVLSAVQAPTLVLHRNRDPTVPLEAGRFVASAIPDARFVELEGIDTAIFCGDSDPILREIRTFLTGVESPPESDRMLATILFTDIVGSTDHAERVGDAVWRSVIEGHDIALRNLVGRFGGTLIQSTGDGILAVFERPTRALHCALEVGEAVKSLGLEVRSGLHTGLCERIGDRVAGLTVHVAARVMSKARAGEVVVSSALAGLVDDPAVAFDDLGSFDLKGVSGQWSLLAARRIAEPRERTREP